MGQSDVFIVLTQERAFMWLPFSICQQLGESAATSGPLLIWFPRQLGTGLLGVLREQGGSGGQLRQVFRLLMVRRTESKSFLHESEERAVSSS